MFVILGLGNPGLEYESTRHNLGFMVVDALAEKYAIRLSESTKNLDFGKGNLGKVPIVIGKPMTYMNESGVAAKEILSMLRLPPNRLIVAHDEIDLILGKIRVKHKGGDAGQLGIRSIIYRLNNDQFSRVRLGVGRPEGKCDIVNHVLSPFSRDERSRAETTIERAVKIIEITLEDLNRKINNSEEEKEC